MPRIDPRQLARPLAVALISLSVATFAVWLPELEIHVVGARSAGQGPR